MKVLSPSAHYLNQGIQNVGSDVFASSDEFSGWGDLEVRSALRKRKKNPKKPKGTRPGKDPRRPASGDGTSPGTVADPASDIFRRDINIQIDSSLGLGDLIGVPNTLAYSKFFGIDQSLEGGQDLVSFRSAPLDVYARIGTAAGDKIRAGLDVSAGFGLGEVLARGGLTGNFQYDRKTGIASADFFLSNASFGVNAPYAYAKIQPVLEFNLNPYLYYRVDPAGSPGPYAGTPSLGNININPNLRPFLDIDTRGQRSASFSAGPGFLNAALPVVDSLIPKAQTVLQKGAYSAKSTVSQRVFQLGYDLASLSPIPLSISGSVSAGIGSLSAGATALEAYAGAALDLSLSTEITATPEVTLALEGIPTTTLIGPDENPDTRYNFQGVSDVNRDGFIDGRMTIDYVIKGAIRADVMPSLTFDVSALSGYVSASLAGFEETYQVGPFFQDSWSLPVQSIPLVNFNGSIRLSDLLGDLGSYSFNFPSGSSFSASSRSLVRSSAVKARRQDAKHHRAQGLLGVGGGVQNCFCLTLSMVV